MFIATELFVEGAYRIVLMCRLCVGFVHVNPVSREGWRT
jgi:hypothetical protein